MRTIKQEFPMNAVSISPLITGKFDPKETKYHCIMGGGVPAREAALVKVITIFFLFRNK
jgi:hypothetical protein